MNNLPANVSDQKISDSIYSREQIDLIKRTVCKGGSDDDMRLLLYHASVTGLSPLARQIYSIERWAGGQKVRSIQVSIDGFRLVAQRSGEYAGQLGPEWCGPDGKWRDVWLDAEPPAAARVAALRCNFEKPLWGVARFDAYAQRNKDGSPRGLWATMPDVMIAKCAEALALRKAFPQELSGLYTSDEMMQASNAPARPTTTLEQDLNDEIPDQFAAPSEPRAAAAAADYGSPHQVAAAATLSLEDEAREAARLGGQAAVQKIFNRVNAADKKKLRAIERELVELYPKQGAESNG
jgi:phage recombination protein Bet